MKKTPFLWIDQYGNRFYARTLRELKERVGPGRVSIMYRDTPCGGAVRVGYVIGQHWLDQYAPVIRTA